MRELERNERRQEYPVKYVDVRERHDRFSEDAGVEESCEEIAFEQSKDLQQKIDNQTRQDASHGSLLHVISSYEHLATNALPLTEMYCSTASSKDLQQNCESLHFFKPFGK